MRGLGVEDHPRRLGAGLFLLHPTTGSSNVLSWGQLLINASCSRETESHLDPSSHRVGREWHGELDKG